MSNTSLERLEQLQTAHLWTTLQLTTIWGGTVHLWTIEQMKSFQASLAERQFKSSPADRSWPKSGRLANQSTTTEVTGGESIFEWNMNTIVQFAFLGGEHNFRVVSTIWFHRWWTSQLWLRQGWFAPQAPQAVVAALNLRCGSPNGWMCKCSVCP